MINEKTTTAVLATACLLSACSKESENTEVQADQQMTAETTVIDQSTKIKGEDYDEAGGADAYANAGDTLNSRYYKNPDFYNLKSDDNLTIIEEFKTMQQTTEWSCGPVTALMVTNHFCVTDITEMDIAVEMKAMTDLDVEVALPGSANNFHEYGADAKDSYFVSWLIDHLENGRPVMVE